MASTPLKRTVSGHDSDKIMYYYKLFEVEPLTNKAHALGLNGATSTTNTKNLSTTQTKTANIKGTGSINQQRVVNVILTDPKKDLTDVGRDLYMAWEKGYIVGLWRVDWNTVQGTPGSRTVNAEFSQCLIANLPETEALGANTATNVTFEVNGVARRYDEKGNPFTLSEEDFDEGMFDMVAKFYNFAKPAQLGTDSGTVKDNTTDDSTGGNAAATKPFGGTTTPSSGQ